MKKPILVYHASKLLCTVEIEAEEFTGAIMSLNKVQPFGDDTVVEVLHIRGMTYGIVIPDNMAEEIYQILADAKEEKINGMEKRVGS